MEGKVLGPFPGNTRFCPITGHPLFFYPSFVVPKSKPGSYRWVLNASWDKGGPSINDRISDYNTTLVGVKTSLLPCLRTQFMSRIDLRRAFKQLSRSISQMYLLATVVDDLVFIDATMSMGLRNTCKIFEEEFMKAFIKGLRHHHPGLFSDVVGNLVDNYLDDIWFLANGCVKNKLQLLVAEFWARWLGIELNEGKREVARSETRHLGFFIDLKLKLIHITSKHKSKILTFFSRFHAVVRCNSRILFKDMQKLLGLQIWISTIFRVARQFLTSICDVLRIAKGNRWFYPRKHKALATRVVQDLKFWQRLVSEPAKAEFNYILDRLPENSGMLSSDASTSFGMAGELHFAQPHQEYLGFAGLFWQVQ